MKKQGTKRMLAVRRGGTENLVYVKKEKTNSRVLFLLLSLLSLGICRSVNLCVFLKGAPPLQCGCARAAAAVVFPSCYPCLIGAKSRNAYTIFDSQNRQGRKLEASKELLRAPDC